MTTGPENAPPAAWQTLAASLDGSFTARARGLLSPEIALLDRTGETFGSLGPDGSLMAGDARASIKIANGSNHDMTSGGTRILASRSAGSATIFEVLTTGQTYDARLSLLRNRATAQTADKRTAAQISGGLSNRRYEAAFDPDDPHALPIALFLLYHLTTLRRRAYQIRA